VLHVTAAGNQISSIQSALLEFYWRLISPVFEGAFSAEAKDAGTQMLTDKFWLKK
jgi:hypothetical protein